MLLTAIFGSVLIIINKPAEKPPLLLQYTIENKPDFTCVYNATVVRPGDSKIYGTKQFEYKIYDIENARKANNDMWNWYAEVYEDCQ